MTSTFSRIFDLKIDFLTFAWPKSCVGRAWAASNSGSIDTNLMGVGKSFEQKPLKK